MSFKTPAGEAAFMAAYDAALARWPVPYSARYIPTRFGSTHVIACGPEDGQPLVLLHAQGSSSTVWSRNVAALSQTYRTFLVDTVGDANKSRWTAPCRSRADYVCWLSDVLDGLGLDRIHLGGLSFGGWLTLNFALANPGRLKGIVLLAPAASLAKFRLAFFIHFLAPMLVPTKASVSSTFRWLSAPGHPFDEGLAEQMLLGVRHFRFAKGIYPTVYDDAELGGLRVPALLLIGDHEGIYDPHLAVERARRLIPGIEAEIVPNAGHVLNMDQSEVVNRRVLAFLERLR